MGSFLWKSVNSFLGAFGFELRPRRRAEPPPITMEGALARLRAREVPIRTVIDGGAAEGKWSGKAMRHFPEAHYLLLEPLEERREGLAAFCAAHPNAAFTCAAIGDREGQVAFNVSSDLDGSGIYGGNHGHAREVPLVTVDSEVERRKLPPPYLLKLDTHGFEVPILAGARRTLEQTNALLVEVYNFKNSPDCLRFHELCAHLDVLGFRCADLVDPLLRPGDQLLWQFDLLFLRKDAPFFAQAHFQAAAPTPESRA
jgi:FkbM family methyltransferase